MAAMRDTERFDAWEQACIEEEAKYAAAQERDSRGLRSRPTFHWGMAAFYTAAFLLLPALSCLRGWRDWLPGDWVFYGLLWAMGCLDLYLSLALARQERGWAVPFRNMKRHFARLDELRGELGSAEELELDPARQDCLEACRAARETWIRDRMLYRREFQTWKDMLPLFAALLAGGLIPVAAASGGWDPFIRVSNLLMTASACALTGLMLCMAQVRTREYKEYLVTEKYLNRLAEARERYLREKAQAEQEQTEEN